MRCSVALACMPGEKPVQNFALLQRDSTSGTEGAAVAHEADDKANCLVQVTPVWRAGPLGPKTLCNACGVRYMKTVKPRR